MLNGTNGLRPVTPRGSVGPCQGLRDPVVPPGIPGAPWVQEASMGPVAPWDPVTLWGPAAVWGPVAP